MAPAMRRLADETLEDRREVSLGLEADAERDIGQLGAWLGQQAAGTAYSGAEEEIMGAQPPRPPQLGREMHAREPGDAGQIGERDPGIDVGIDVRHDAPEPPLRQRRPAAPRPIARAAMREIAGAL